MTTQSQTERKSSRWTIKGKSLGRRIRHYRIWFGISLASCLLIGFLYGYLKTPHYEVSTSLLLEDIRGMQWSAEKSDGTEAAQSPNLQNEIGFLRSRELIAQNLEYLGFEVQVFERAFWQDQELFSDLPFNVVLDQTHPQLEGTQIHFQIISVDSFLLSAETDDPYLYYPQEERLQWLQERKVKFSLRGKFGTFLENQFLKALIVMDSALFQNNWTQRELYFVINDREVLAENYLGELQVIAPNSSANIVELKHQGPVLAKEKAFLDGLVKRYLEHQILEKNRIAESRLQFIESQISALSDSIEGTVAALGSPRKTLERNDLRLTAGNAVQQLQQFQSQKSSLESRRSYFTELVDLLEKDTDPTVLVSPTSIGIDEPILSESIVELKRLYSEKVIKSVAAGEQSLEMQYLNRMIRKTHQTLLTHAISSLQQTDQAIRNVNRRISQANEVVRNLPGEEQFLHRIDEQFVFNDNLYNYLLQQRMEAKMAQASNVADSKVLDPAHVLGLGPVSPKKGRIMIIAAFIGLALPFFGIILRSIVNNRVLDVQQIEQRINATVLGHILHAPPEVQGGNLWGDERALAIAENFRYLFVNLQFMAFKKACRVIAITSTVPNEGKTFCSVNLAQVMAANGQRVLLIGADIRKPRVHKYISIRNEAGLTQYLSGQASKEAIIQDTSQIRLKCIASGPVIANPAELLDGDRFPQLVKELEADFDYIIIDTPPAGLFADYLQVARFSDINLYLLRQRHSKLDYLYDIESMRSHANLQRFYLIFNDVKYGKNYRTRYGYDYTYKYRDQVTAVTGDTPNGQNWNEDLIRKG